MSKRRGGTPKRRDNEFTRHGLTRETEKQLFNPRSDNPIAFNKRSSDTQETKKPTRRLWSAAESSSQVTIETKKQPVSEEEQLKKKKWKSLIASLRHIESKLEALTEKSRAIACFQEDHDVDQQRSDKEEQKYHVLLVEQDILDAELIWKEKIQLHLDLSHKYLEVLRCDLDYAEKKGLESLCWKRAVYSLVDQFRKFIKKSADKIAASQNNAKKSAAGELAAELFEDEDEMIPVIHEGGGMTLIKSEKPTSKHYFENDVKLQIKQANMTLGLFLHYLDLADAFYVQLTLFLKSVDDDDDDTMEQSLNQWRRTRRYKWYSCVSLRGDLARYRWAYTPEEDKEGLTRWSKADAFLEAWKRYELGIWLMPAKGNLYFNLSLLLPGQSYEFHRFYLSMRSLMVRRNGFLNARESMLILFEGNRRWIQKYTTKRSKQPIDIAIPALFVRLHGMLFTKIGLDEFPQIKRIFFNTLFETKTEAHVMAERCGVSLQKPSRMGKINSFSASHLFWFEMIVLCLSSLYTYDYANSKLTKLISLYSTKVFDPDSPDQYEPLLNELRESVLFTYEIDLTCQMAVELLQRYLNPSLPPPKVPMLPKLPHVSFQFKQSKPFIFSDAKEPMPTQEDDDEEEDDQAWLVYIEILLHWMVLNGICIRTKELPSLWERLVGDIGHDLIQNKRFMCRDNAKISSAFWPLLLQFLNKLLSELTSDDKYDMVNKHLMDEEEEQDVELAFAKNVCNILGQAPDLPEEHHLRGLGWVDEIHGRFLKLEPDLKKDSVVEATDMLSRRKTRILEYGFTLVKHLDGILYYDPVEEMFTVSRSIEERMSELEIEETKAASMPLEEEQKEIPMVTIEEMDDDVLLSSETELDDTQDGDDDIMTQLKKRREQLQSIVATAEAEERHGFRRLPGRAKEREARLNYLRECIIPGKTILVLDTNCFIGHIDHVKKLLQSQKWSVIVPLVVVTELDGLKTNPHRLGFVAQQGIQLLETTLSSKPKQSTLLRIQTSHNNFMNDISIRSEQFVFGETDKNLDDLILSACLWWISQQPQDDNVVPVCLVTGDRNLSVKARARDVEVVPVSAIIQLTPR